MRGWRVKQTGYSSTWRKRRANRRRQRQARAGDSKVVASSSGPATSKEEVPRSRGGAPRAADSGDSAPAIVKIKIGAGEQGESEDPKSKNNKQ